jgi:hypothetical protein
VLLAAGPVHALHAELEDGEEAFNRIRVDATAYVLTGAMAHKIMACKIGVDAPIMAGFVGVDGGSIVHRGGGQDGHGSFLKRCCEFPGAALVWQS